MTMQNIASYERNLQQARENYNEQLKMSESIMKKKTVERQGACSAFFALITCQSTKNKRDEQSDNNVSQGQIIPEGGEAMQSARRTNGQRGAGARQRQLVQIRAQLPQQENNGALINPREQRQQQFEVQPSELLPKQKPQKISNIVVESQYKLEDVLVVDFLPQDRELRYQFKYYCPICLRYFNCMLISQCCMNYLCHYCADEIMERERNVEAYKAQCPNNCDGAFILKDVNPTAQVKRYSDSQYMSFYSNNLGKMTAQSQGFYHTKTKGGPITQEKENKSPEMTTPYDPFGDQEYKTKYFQNSATQFMRRPPQLDGENGMAVTSENGGEESKSITANNGLKFQPMTRSDAYHRHKQEMQKQAPQARRPPLQQIRQNAIFRANIPAGSSSNGFAPQNSLPRSNRSIQFDDQGNYNDIYDLHRNTLQSPDMPENFAPSGEYYPISPGDNVPPFDMPYIPQPFPRAQRSFGSSLVGETFGALQSNPDEVMELRGESGQDYHDQSNYNYFPQIPRRNQLMSQNHPYQINQDTVVESHGYVMREEQDYSEEGERLRLESVVSYNQPYPNGRAPQRVDRDDLEEDLEGEDEDDDLERAIDL